MALLLCCSLFLLVSFCHATSNLLLVGNSYLRNGVPVRLALKAMLEETSNDEIVDVYEHAPDGYQLVQHLADTERSTHQLRDWLVNKPLPWTWVVVHEQSQFGGFSRLPLMFGPSLRAAVKLNQMAVGNSTNPGGGTKTIFLMTWGRRDGDPQNPALYPNFLTMNAKLAEGYRRYAEATGTQDHPTRVAPVGLAFQRVYESVRDKGLDPTAEGSDFHNLYSVDGSHASVEGSYLEACVLFATLTGKDPRVLAYADSSLSESTRLRLQSVAYFTMIEYAHDWYPITSTADTTETAIAEKQLRGTNIN